MDLIIFWNHVGREHGGLNYTDDIRKNSPEVIQKALLLKEQRCRSNGRLNRFIRHDESTLVELPPLHSDRKYIIIYCIDTGIQFSLHFKSRYSWWLIDIVDIQEIRPQIYCIHDLFIDIAVNRDGSYHVFDVDEFEAALSLGVMTQEQISRGLKSFHHILTALNSKDFPYTMLEDIQKMYMPSITDRSLPD